jgi:hypothetical protein
LIHEWQRVPAVCDAVRRSVDEGAAAGSFLLTGSAAPDRAPTHTGAGRVVNVRMRPTTLPERDVATPSVSLMRLHSGTASSVSGSTNISPADYASEIIQTGFPAIRSLSGRAHRMQLDGYLQRIIDVDFQEYGASTRRPDLLQRWMAAYAAATATTASYETIRDAATARDGNKSAKTTTIPYREVLERLWIIDSGPGMDPVAKLSQSALPITEAPPRGSGPGSPRTGPGPGRIARQRGSHVRKSL